MTGKIWRFLKILPHYRNILKKSVCILKKKFQIYLFQKCCFVIFFLPTQLLVKMLCFILQQILPDNVKFQEMFCQRSISWEECIKTPWGTPVYSGMYFSIVYILGAYNEHLNLGLIFLVVKKYIFCHKHTHTHTHTHTHRNKHLVSSWEQALVYFYTCSWVNIHMILI